ncbi:potassium-transporting ATPase subunit KdpA [Acidiferrobacter sp.]|uniref:potassium-transporting ATPase subunit KdpA n=1 Tax=Acidiferrobacter sp. TaxID=1872107 RepID=UPI00262E55EF|nr:potassium-transporting ATPase subunit KdpA [Acidiferrobacter sp.]
MSQAAFWQIVLELLAAGALSVPFGHYLARVFQDQKTLLDPILDPVDDLIYRLIGRDVVSQAMDWKGYAVNMLLANLLMGLLIYVILSWQGHLPGNPLHFPDVDPFLAFNTAASFITNTNWQNYGGGATLSLFSQMAAITFPMFTSAATGFVVAIAFFRALAPARDKGYKLGNFYRDFVRVLTRVFLLPCLFITPILVWAGSPETLTGMVTAHLIQGGVQHIPMGPVADLEVIKHFGTNGGGFFNANSAHPFENPTPLSNIIETLLMMVTPMALVITFGRMVGNRKLARVMYSIMASMLVVALFIAVIAEQRGTPLLAHVGLMQHAGGGQMGGNMVGKEVRFGITQSAIFDTVSTAFTTGAVNSTLDSYTPLGGMVSLVQMMLNCVFGGKGVGVLNFLMYGVFAVFIAGLMVGRTPEFLGKKIEKREIVLASLALLIHPLIILIPTAWSLMAPYGAHSLGNSGSHGLSEVLYAFTSAAANNGSAFAGLNGNTPWYNVSLGLVMLFGRYASIIFMLAIAGSLAAKPSVQETIGTLKTDTALFGGFWFATIVVVGALTFFPGLVLGPIAEFFALYAHHALSGVVR